MSEHRDVLEDDPPTLSGGTCSGGCEHGWKHVAEPYALHAANEAGPDGSNDHRQRLASARNTVYPCRVCRPAAFFRWAGKHFDPEHERAGCAECVDVRSSHTRRAKRATTPASYEPPPPPERRDLD